MAVIKDLDLGLFSRRVDVEVPDDLLRDVRARALSGLAVEGELVDLVNGRDPRVRVVSTTERRLTLDALESLLG